MREIVVELEDGRLERATESELRDYARAARVASSVRVWIDGVPTTLGEVALSDESQDSDWRRFVLIAVVSTLAVLILLLVLLIAIFASRSRSDRGPSGAPNVAAPPSAESSESKEPASEESATDEESGEEVEDGAEIEGSSDEEEAEDGGTSEEGTEDAAEEGAEDETSDDEEGEDESVSEEDADEAEEDSERAYPAVVYVPDDFQTLAEALDFVQDGGEIVVKNRSEPYRLGNSDAFFDEGSRGALAAKNATIRSEKRRPRDAVVLVDRNERFIVDNSLTDGTVEIIGLTFKLASTRPRSDDEFALVDVERGTAEFRDCIFKGDRAAPSTGARIVGAFASAKFVGCQFLDLGRSGLYIGSDSGASVVRSLFDSRGPCGVCVAENGNLNVVDSIFDRNDVGVYVETQASGAVRNCRFERNRENWILEDDWRDAKILFLGNREE